MCLRAVCCFSDEGPRGDPGNGSLGTCFTPSRCWRRGGPPTTHWHQQAVPELTVGGRQSPADFLGGLACAAATSSPGRDKGFPPRPQVPRKAACPWSYGLSAVRGHGRTQLSKVKGLVAALMACSGEELGKELAGTGGGAWRSWEGLTGAGGGANRSWGRCWGGVSRS